VRGASEGAILAGRFTKNPYGVLGGTIVGGVIGSAVGHELAQTTIEALRKVGCRRTRKVITMNAWLRVQFTNRRRDVLGLWHSSLFIGPLGNIALVAGLVVLSARFVAIPLFVEVACAILVAVWALAYILDTIFATYAERHNTNRSDDVLQPPRRTEKDSS
jgi:hypothetical protein